MDRNEAMEVYNGLIDQKIKEAFEFFAPELKESEDERIRKAIFQALSKHDARDVLLANGIQVSDALSWLERQDGHIKFLRSIQIGDEVTRNPDGVLVNLSQLKRVAKQGSQNLASSEKTCKDEQKPTWSEEDEKFFKTALWHISYSVSNGKSTDIRCDTTEWLKALKERYTWKPSDEQMHYLSWIANIKLGDGVVEQEVSKHLNELYNDLKKLKG